MSLKEEDGWMPGRLEAARGLQWAGVLLPDLGKWAADSDRLT